METQEQLQNYAELLAKGIHEAIKQTTKRYETKIALIANLKKGKVNFDYCEFILNRYLEADILTSQRILRWINSHESDSAIEVLSNKTILSKLKIDSQIKNLLNLSKEQTEEIMKLHENFKKQRLIVNQEKANLKKDNEKFLIEYEKLLKEQDKIFNKILNQNQQGYKIYAAAGIIAAFLVQLPQALAQSGLPAEKIPQIIKHASDLPNFDKIFFLIYLIVVLGGTFVILINLTKNQNK